MEAVAGLTKAVQEGVDLMLDAQRRKALYPTLDSMEARTAQIRMAQAHVPLARANRDMDHLLHHIDMLKAALNKQFS